MAERTIRVERDGAVASIVLANPPLNLFTDTAFEELVDCIGEVEASDARPSSGAPRARSSAAASTSTPSSASSTPGASGPAPSPRR